MSTNTKMAEALRLAREWFRHEEAGEGPQAYDVIKAADEAIAAHDAEQAQEPVPGVIWGCYGEDGASLVQRGKEDEMIGRNGGRRLYLAPVEQAAKAVPALYVGLIERLMRLSTRLGIAYEGGVEHFAASLEDRLYAICRGAESLLNSVATPPAPEAQQPAGQEQDERAAFEAWAATYSTFPLERDDYPRLGTTSYTAMEQAMLWDAWQARAALAQRREPLTDGQLSALLKEARKIIRASSSRSLAKDWDRRATQALAGATTGEQHG